MNDIWLAEIKKAMEEKAITMDALAAQLQIGVTELERLLQGDMRLSFAQLSALTSYLDMDFNEAMGYEGVMDLVLHDELEIQINEIARGIPAKRRSYFVQAVRYLADLFHTKDDEDDEEQEEACFQQECAPSSKKKTTKKKAVPKQRRMKQAEMHARVQETEAHQTKKKECIKG